MKLIGKNNRLVNQKGLSQYFVYFKDCLKEGDPIRAIIDYYGTYEQLWQFSAYVKSAGLKILEVGSEDKFLDVNFDRIEPDYNCIEIRAEMNGKPRYVTVNKNGRTYKAIQVEEKIYILDRKAIV